jgi:hypothetical protein
MSDIKRDLKNRYKDEIFLIQLPEGGEFLNGKIKYFSAGCVTGDISDKGNNLGFYAKVVGFYDKKCPQRTWGKTIKSFKRKMFKIRKGKYA